MAWQGAFSAHLRAWEQLAERGDHGAIILEDDAQQFRRAALSVGVYPTDGITLLGGCFRAFGGWSPSDNIEQNGVLLDVLASLVSGCNPMPQRARAEVHHGQSPGGGQAPAAQDDSNQVVKWTMCVAYFIPPGFARVLCDAVAKTRKRSLTSPDIWLSPFVRYCWWPNPFGDGGAPSQCFGQHREPLRVKWLLHPGVPL